MNLQKLRLILRRLSDQPARTSLLYVDRRSSTNYVNKSSVTSMDEIINKLTFIKNGKYVLTHYDSHVLQDTCNRLLRHFDTYVKDQVTPLTNLGYYLLPTKKGFDLYYYDQETKFINLMESIKLYSTNSVIYRWILKIFRLV